MKKIPSHELKSKIKSHNKNTAKVNPSNRLVRPNVTPTSPIGLKPSKSKRQVELPEIGKFSGLDYLYLLLYFIILYSFYVGFWFSMWMIYTKFLSEKKSPKNSTNPITSGYGSYTLMGSEVKCMY